MYIDIRGADGRLLFRYDPERGLVEIRVRGTGVTEVIDLTQHGHAAAGVVPIVILPPDVADGREERSRRVDVPQAAAR